ncbi:uromodulin-like [Orbicella faveolata]|uniref:uromodulin-like n=1 Tax=Orbicella faveolata TaxID=48498 RepID=UPI0009E58025|nr:uromodulin-like [Orbicella faveolata]
MNWPLFVLASLFCLGFPTSSTAAPEFVQVGCFKDMSRQRALPKLLVSYRGTIDWNTDLNYIVRKCAQEAKKKNHMYFSVQFYGECWSGDTAPMTYDRYGKSTRCTATVGGEFANMVYRFVGDEKECLNYATLSSASRSSTYQLPIGSTPSCDDGLPSGWYRFSNPAGDKMASTCLPSGKCGTVVTGWLETAHPRTADGIISGKVCFRWGSNCCQWSQNIHLRNCGRFYVYKLGKTFACPMGFCGITSSRPG